MAAAREWRWLDVTRKTLKVVLRILSPNFEDCLSSFPEAYGVGFPKG
jgi:hypothetical protein